MKIHAPLLPLAVCLMAGIVLGEWLDLWLTGLVVLVPMVLVTLLLGRWPRWQTLGIGCCVVALGAVLSSRTRASLLVEWPADRQQMEVIVVSEPVVKEKWVVADVLSGHRHLKLKCRIARDDRSEQLQIGSGLLLRAYINKVHEWHNGHFDYQRYMACHGFSGEMYVHRGDWMVGQVSLTELSLMERVRLRALCWRHQLLERYREWGIGSSAYGVLAAMTLGDKSHLDAGVREVFARVGASHVLALSGLHLMIIYSFISLFLGWHRFRMPAQVLTALAVWAFAFLVGLSPSVVRSAFMISVYALLSLGYRERMSVNTLAFVAIIMLIVNPLSLYDVGFQLSFAAVLAIVLLNPLFGCVFPPDVMLRHRWLGRLWGLTTVSLSAQLGTAPLVAYYFGTFASYFLLSNMVVIPLATMVLYLALMCVCFSWWPMVLKWLVVALSLLTVLMGRLLEWISRLPGCSIRGISISWVQLLLIYVVIIALYVAVSLRCRGFQRNG